ncbi:transglutaminase family protein [Pseudotabrizicola sp. L79]|uniref:transglutaminase family protein n=1 Tax=Pseudotabrizicola sp. L79 TaxID=3118402 RepID=UPI002F92DFAB
MRYDIRLTIDYDYAAPSDHARNILRLLPSDGPRQRVVSRMLTISPLPDDRRDGVDFFGNATSSVGWHQPIKRARFQVQARAERLAEAELDLSPPLADLGAALAATGLGPTSPQHFRAPSPRIPGIEAITAFARAALPPAPTARQAVQAVGQALHGAMTFDATATDVATPPDQAFAARRGVCQDFAQIMIAGLRAIGLPAGYVSGFLRTNPPPGQPRLEGVDAMHAWVSAWCGPDQGWVEYDPTNAQWAGQDYITVAMGRDYGDVAPVRGAIRTAGGHDSRHSVDVLPIGDAP